MRIRTRLTLWLGGILVVSLFVMAHVLHHELAEQRELSFQKNPDSVWHEVGEVIVFYGLPTMVLLLLGIWWLLRKSLAPVVALTMAAEKIQVNDLKQHLPRSGNGDELDRLTVVFNSMMRRLDESVSNIREFTLNASHELKTPLTIMRAEIETALRDETMSLKQTETFASLLDEISRLTHIVDSLSVLAKADAGQIPLQREPLRLDELVKENLQDAKLLAEPMRIEVSLETCDSAPLLGDRHRLKQLLLILVDNAIKYNRADGRVSIDVSNKDGGAELKIANTGEGVPPEKLPRVFERFYRGNLAHQRIVDGSGLGLSIAKWIVEAHGGAMQMQSQVNEWTTVVVTFHRS